jgi:DNA-directed RNA polymerase subunit RPC12/RpoP
MNENFIKLIQKIVKERGKDILNNIRLTKALFMDYSHGEYKNEINLLLKLIELGYPNRIQETDDLDSMRLILSRQLVENHFIIEKMAVQIVSLLIALIKDEEYDNKRRESIIEKHMETQVKKSILATPENGQHQKEKSSTNHSVLIEEKESKDIKTTSFTKIIIGKWTCDICDQENSENLLICKGCGAYKPSRVKIKFSDNNIPININSVNESKIQCFNCGRIFTTNIKEDEFVETNCKYCNKKISLRNVVFI